MKPSPIHYELRLMTTDSGAGFFACRPQAPLSFDAQLSYLEMHPNDEFMRKELLLNIAALEKKQFKKKLKAASRSHPLLHSLLYEASLLYEKFSGMQSLFATKALPGLSSLSPLIYMKSNRQKDQQNHLAWIRLFRQNLFDHRLLPPPDQTGLTPLPEADTVGDDGVSIQEITRGFNVPASASSSTDENVRSAPSETARRAIERLEQIDIFSDIEKRHESSLSPMALLRQWRMHRTVDNRRLHYTLSGIQTSYGKGLSLDAARASCVMEIVERHSAFADVTNEQISGYQQTFPLTCARFSELAADGIPALNPNELLLEAPYDDAPLHWMEGVRVKSALHEPLLEPIWIPAQCVFLFCNLDEIKLFSGLGSTGLASGNSLAEAKRSALLEIIERDSENTTPYHPSLCFRLTTEDPAVTALLERFRSMGIHVRFQDLTAPMGIPCCKCFVEGMDGQIYKGTGAHLNAGKALISALTETPYPFHGPPSRPLLEKTTIVPIENLPDYSTGNPEGDVSLLEQLLCANDLYPVYANLTRRDLNMPVVRALIPGMELISDFDRFSRVNPRLYQNYLKLFG